MAGLQLEAVGGGQMRYVERAAAGVRVPTRYRQRGTHRYAVNDNVVIETIVLCQCVLRIDRTIRNTNTVATLGHYCIATVGFLR